MTLRKTFTGSFAAAVLAVVSTLSTPTRLSAADHGDAPALAQDLGADINDVFLFLDPSDISQTVLIATVHGFLVPGEVPNFAVFDENIRYRFEIYNDHVNLASPVLDSSLTPAQKANFFKRIRPNRLIDITFSKRQVGLADQKTLSGTDFIPRNLRRPVPQEATITLTGFTGLNGNVFKSDATDGPLQVTPFNVATVAPDFDFHDIKLSASATLQFFAGEVDDPFFFDIPAFTSFVDGIRNRVGANVGAFSRQRDTFGGYNTLAIAIRIPTILLQSEAGPIIGLDFLTQRHATELKSSQGSKGVGAFKTVDRMGNPTVNVALIPFDLKNAYNGGTAKGDAQGQFASVIATTLSQLGVDINTPEQSFLTLVGIAVAYGDILKLDTSISNFNSPAGAGFPNGRRLQDDTVDTVLTTINHGMTVSDGVANSGTGLQAVGTSSTSTFPFLGKPNQPLPNGSTDPTQN